MADRAPLTLAIVAACLLLAWFGEPAAGALALTRAGILHGEAWRLWSGHAVHYSLRHAAADALALGAAGMLVERQLGTRRLAWLLAGAAPALSLALLAWPHGVLEYRGASGLAVALAVLAGTPAWRRVPARRPWLTGALAALAVKTWWEAGGHASAAAALPAGVAVAWEAHLLGALLGAGAGVAGAWRERPRPGRISRSSGSDCG